MAGRSTTPYLTHRDHHPAGAAEASGDPSRWGRHVSAATRLARESLSEARRSVDALRPEPLERALLSDALAGVAERWSALHGIPVQVTTTGTARRVPPDAEFALLRAAQEALANVAADARATRVGLDAVLHGPRGRPGCGQRPGFRRVRRKRRGFRPGRDAAADRGPVRDGKVDPTRGRPPSRPCPGGSRRASGPVAPRPR
jgi:hypothetical protein